MKANARPAASRGNSRKISISVTGDDLAVLTARARRRHGGNVSAVIHEMIAALRREEAAEELLRALGADRVTPREMDEIRGELAGKKPARRRGAA